jgi:preprotein translocase subunit SecG
MDILIGILTVVEVIVCILMILIVLMQRPRQEGLGASFGDGAMTQLVGAQTTNVLQKGTVYLALTLFVLTISLAVLTSRKQAGQKKEVFSAPPAEAPAAPVTPAAEPAKTGDAAKTPAPAIEVKPSAETAKPAEAANAPEMKEPAEVKVTPAPAEKSTEAAPKPAPATAAPTAPAAAVTPVPEAAKTPAAPAKNP